MAACPPTCSSPFMEGHVTSRNDFLDTTPKAQSIKEIVDILDIIKIKTFCSLIDIVKKNKVTDWKKIFAKIYLIKNYIQNMQKKFLKFSNKKTISLKNKIKSLIDISSQKIYTWQISR